MNKLYASIFLASILLITSCGDGNSGGEHCYYFLNPGESMDVTDSGGVVVTITNNGPDIADAEYPCGALIVQ